MDTELKLFRAEWDTMAVLIIAFDLDDAKRVFASENMFDDMPDKYTQIGFDEIVEIEEPDGILQMQKEYSYLPKSGRVFVRATARDWIDSHGRGTIGSTEW